MNKKIGMFLFLLRTNILMLDLPFCICRYILGVQFKAEKHPELRRGTMIIVPQTTSPLWDNFIVRWVHSVYTPGPRVHQNIVRYDERNAMIHMADELVYIHTPLEKVQSVYHELVTEKKQDVMMLSIVAESFYDIREITNTEMWLGKYPFAVAASLVHEIKDDPLLVWKEQNDNDNPITTMLTLIFTWFAVVTFLFGDHMFLMSFLYETTVENHIMRRHEVLDQWVLICAIVYALIVTDDSMTHMMVTMKGLIQIISEMSR